MDTARAADPDPTLKKNTDPTSKENVATDPTDWRTEFANPDLDPIGLQNVSLEWIQPGWRIRFRP